MIHIWVSIKLFSKLLVSLIYFTKKGRGDFSSKNPRGLNYLGGQITCPLFISPSQNNLAPSHKQKFLRERCRIQHHMPKDPRRVLPTCVLGNGHTNLSPACGPSSNLVTSSGSSQSWSRGPWKILS